MFDPGLAFLGATERIDVHPRLGLRDAYGRRRGSPTDIGIASISSFFCVICDWFIPNSRIELIAINPQADSKVSLSEQIGQLKSTSGQGSRACLWRLLMVVASIFPSLSDARGSSSCLDVEMDSIYYFHYNFNAFILIQACRNTTSYSMDPAGPRKAEEVKCLLH
jgi:hypothetical protein